MKLGVSSLAHSTPVGYQGIPADSSRKFIAFLIENAASTLVVRSDYPGPECTSRAPCGRATGQPVTRPILRRAMNPAITRPHSISIHSAGSGFAATEKVNCPGDVMTSPDIRVK